MKAYLLFIITACCFRQNVLSQNIGINATGAAPHPSAMLDVSATNKGMLVPGMTSAQRTAIAAPAVGLLVFDNETTSFWFYKATGWTELITGGAGAPDSWNLNGANIYNSNAGNIGIGTANPVTKLTVQTPINSTGFTHIGGADSIIFSEAIGGVSAALGTSTNHALRLNTNGTGKLHIYPAGEVVVGGNSSAAFGRFTVETNNNSFGISHTSVEGNVLATQIGGTSAGIGTFTHTNMRIFSNGISRILIAEATGNVGIGTDNPTYKLSVNGNIRGKEVVVETGWADYVFDKKYKLSPLDAVEKFIQEHNHLPNIPSAKEIEEKGLNLGDTQKRMMEKIEELTLYIIEADKRIEKLEQLNKEKK